MHLYDSQWCAQDICKYLPNSIYFAITNSSFWQGHVDKFEDFMVKDKKNGECHRADKLICEAIEKTIKKKGNKIKADEKQRLEKIMQDCENYDAP